MSEMTLKFEGKDYVVIGSRAPMKGDYFIGLNLDNSAKGVLKAVNNWGASETVRLIVEPVSWKPQKGDIYFFPVCVTFGVSSVIWRGDSDDERFYKEGMVFQTEKEVEELLIKMKELVKGFRGECYE